MIHRKVRSTDVNTGLGNLWAKEVDAGALKLDAPAADTKLEFRVREIEE